MGEVVGSIEYYKDMAERLKSEIEIYKSKVDEFEKKRRTHIKQVSDNNNKKSFKGIPDEQLTEEQKQQKQQFIEARRKLQNERYKRIRDKRNQEIQNRN